MARHINDKVDRMGYRAWIQWMISHRLGWGNINIPWNQPKGTIQAFVTEGLWYAYCSDPNCKTPIIVDDREPVFFCVRCLNAKNDGHPHSVEFVNKHEVEELFAKRKNPSTRNWHPGETIADLKREQRARGEL